MTDHVNKIETELNATMEALMKKHGALKAGVGLRVYQARYLQQQFIKANVPLWLISRFKVYSDGMIQGLCIGLDLKLEELESIAEGMSVHGQMIAADLHAEMGIQAGEEIEKQLFQKYERK